MNTKIASSILSVEANATPQEVKKAYRTLSKQLHPDNQRTGNEYLYKQVQEAYEFLKGSRVKAKPQGVRPSPMTVEETRFTHSNIFGDVKRQTLRY